MKEDNQETVNPEIDTLLSQKQRVAYSERERSLYDLLGIEKQTSTKLCERFYEKQNLPVPFEGQKRILVALRHLQKKVDFNNEKTRICSTKRSGPIAMQFWLEQRHVPVKRESSEESVDAAG